MIMRRIVLLLSALSLGVSAAEAQITLTAYRDSVAGYDWRGEKAGGGGGRKH